MHTLKIILYVIFTFICLILGAIVLLQEPRGGGLGAAFGGAGGDAFGHGAGGVNKFTSVVGGLFFVTAIAIAWLETAE